MKYVAPTTLDKDGAVGIGMWINGPGGALATDVAGESHTHSTAGGFGEE